MTELQALWSRASHVAFVDDGDRVVVLDLSGPKATRPLLLTGPAAWIWRGLEQPASLDEICGWLKDQLQSTRAHREEVAPLVSRLASERLVTSE